MSHTLSIIIQSKDLQALHEHLKNHRLHLEELRRLLKDDSLRYVGLLYLQEHAPQTKQREVLEAYAALLPRELPAGNEEQAILAELYLRLWPWNRARFFPRWREACSLPLNQVAWCRAEILIDPATLSVWGDDEVLLQAMRSLRPADILHPKALLAELLRSPFSVLQREAFELLPPLLHSCALLPLEARELLLLALQSAHSSARAYMLLAQPWARVLGCSDDLQRALMADTLPSLEMVRCAALWSMSAPLLRILEEKEATLSVQQEALALLGELVEREQLSWLLGLAASDPALFGEPCLTLLTGAHRRGVFIKDEHVADLLSLFFHHQRLPAKDLARLAFTSRREVFSQLSALPPDSPHWERAAPLVVALGLGPRGRQELPVAALLLEKLNAASRYSVFLDALLLLSDESTEEALLSWLPRAPHMVLSILRQIGGEATRQKLHELLGVLTGEPAPSLLAVYPQALTLLWQLSSFEEKQALLPLLEPAQLPPELSKDLSRMIPPAAKSLLMYQADKASVQSCVLQVARFGDEGDWPLLVNLCLRLVTEIAAGERLNEREKGEEQRTLSEEVISALQAYGGRLHSMGRLRPRFLLTEHHNTVVALCVELLSRRDLSVEETSVLLRALRPFNSPLIFNGVYHLLREEDPHLRKLVVFLLAKEGAEILSVNLSRLTEANDIQTVRQALAGLGQSKAAWAVQDIARCLEHKNMNIKKVAAEALVGAATPEAVPAMLAWVGRHDNPGFRESLISALKNVLKDAYTATIIAAAQATEDAHRQDLLLSALTETLSLRQVRRIVQRQLPISSLLLQRLQGGGLLLRGESLEALYLELERQGVSLHQPEKPAPVMSPEVLTLDAQGWSPALAAQIVQQPAWSPAERAVLRRFLAEWLQLSQTEDAALQQRAFTLLVALEPFTSQELALLARRVGVLLLGLSHQGAPYQSACLRLLEAVCTKLSQSEALWVASCLRGLPELPQGNRSYLALLKLCGAIWTREDVAVALSRCLRGLDHRAETMQVLAEAFGAYAPKLVPAPLREYLAQCVSAGRLPERARCDELLSTLRKELPTNSREELSSRALLSGLFEIFAESTKPNQQMLLDWYLTLQPIGAPAWVLQERARTPDATQRGYDATLREGDKQALLTLLLVKEKATDAAERLNAWPGRELDAPLFEAFLKGYWVWLPSLAPRLHRVFSSLSASEVSALCQSPTPSIQILLLLSLASTELKHAYLPLIISLQRHGSAEVSAQARRTLRSISSEVILDFIYDEVMRGEWPLLSLLSGPVVSTYARRQLSGKYHDKPSVSSWLQLKPPLLRAEPSSMDEARLANLQERRVLPTPKQQTRAELFELARGKDEEASRKALTTLSATPDAPLVELLVASLERNSTRVRLHAYRLLRSCASKEIYLDASQRLLHDPLMDVQRSAIRAVMFARYLPAIPAVVALLQHPHQAIQVAAQEGLLFNEEAALPALKKAMKDARPDKREPFLRLIRTIEARQNTA